MLRKIFSGEQLRTIKAAFRRTETELNDHLDSINANSQEIQSLYELLAEIEQKMEKMATRMDALELHAKTPKHVKEYTIQPLTRREKEVFVSLYTAESATYKEISRKTGLEEVMVQEYITALIAKGVPVTKRYQNNQIFVSLDKQFKENQAKEKVVELL